MSNPNHYDPIELSIIGSKPSRHNSVSFQQSPPYCNRSDAAQEHNDDGVLSKEEFGGRPQRGNGRGNENPFHFAPIRFTAEQAVLKRNFGSLSILALSITLLASWESIAR